MGETQNILTVEHSKELQVTDALLVHHIQRLARIFHKNRREKLERVGDTGTRRIKSAREKYPLRSLRVPGFFAYLQYVEDVFQVQCGKRNPASQ